MRRGKHEDDEGGDVFRQQKETKAIRLGDDEDDHQHSMRAALTTTISCLMVKIINSIYEAASINCLYSGKKFSIQSTSSSSLKENRGLTSFRPTVKMLTTFIIILALMATCYPLAQEVSAAQNQHQQPAQQVFPGPQNSHNLPSQLDISQGNSIDSLKQQEEQQQFGLRAAGWLLLQIPRAARLSRRRRQTQELQRKLRQPRAAPLSGSNRQAAGSGSSNENELQSVGQTSSGLATSAYRLPSSIIRNVTAQNGQSVLLHCIVEPSSELVVSWFRGTGEPQLLTYESNTVIDDQRFVVRHGLLKEDDWALQIKNLDKTTDSGLYQCQTNSEPPQSQFYQLNVIEPQVNISGAPDMAVKLGSAINLTCIISQSPDQLQFIFWYRNDRMINYDINERGKIVISKWPQKQGTITSNLQIFHSKLADSGNYTCSPSGARPMSIYVHVLEGLDKRLTMFQNDHYEPSAASSQQTNSALSVHVVRLSKGRVYALFVAYVIFASWFQLVTQAQTAVSFLLLAIIGFFLGKVTGNSDDYQFKEEEQGRVKGKNTGKSKAQFVDDDDSQSDELQQNGQPNDNSNASTIDPLIRRANSALNLLKSLSSSSSSSSSSGGDDNHQTDQDLDTTDGNNEQETTLQELAHQPGHNGAIILQKAPLNSPSGASTSSSFASTGYNSDSRSTNLVLVQPLPVPAIVDGDDDDGYRRHKLSLNGRRRRFIRGPNDDQAEGDTCEMIELVTEPTAMSLLMEEFERDHKSSPQSLSPVTISGSSNTPIKPPRLVGELQLPPQQQQQQRQQPTQAKLNRKQLDSTESHYSSPTNSLAYPNSRSSAKHSLTRHSLRSPSSPS